MIGLPFNDRPCLGAITQILATMVEQHRVVLLDHGREDLRDGSEARSIIERQSNHVGSPLGVTESSAALGGAGGSWARSTARARAIASGTVSAASSPSHALRCVSVR